MGEQAIFLRFSRVATRLVVALLASAGAESRADSVRFIPDGKDAWQTRVEMIRAARSSIDVAVFIWRDDHTGLEIAGLLQEATTRGVRVRIIADGLARSLPSRVTAALAGTELLHIHDYHPLLVHRLDWLNCRLHDKLLIVDGGRLLIGGRNFTDRYYNRRADWCYIDLDLLVTGRACTEAQGYFDSLWESGETRNVPRAPLIKPLNGGRFRARTDRETWHSQQAGQRLIDGAMGTLYSGKCGDRRGVFCVAASRMEFVHEQVPRTSNQSVCVTRIEELLGKARREVWISTPWLVTTERTEALLRECLARGVKLHVVTNSLNASRDYLVFAAHARTCKELAAQGAVIHLLPGPGSLHSKAIIIDESVAIAGTLNFDPRSEFWNTESMVVIRDTKTARELLDVIRSQSCGSHLLTPDEPFLTRVEKPSLMVRAKKAFLPMLELFSPLIRSFL